MLLDADQFDFSSERREYVQELSSLKQPDGFGFNRATGPCSLTLRNCPAPGQHRSFTLTKTDKSGGDIAGWRFQECQGPNYDNDNPLRVLLIND